MQSLTPEQAETLVNLVLNGPTLERPTALFNLVKMVYDPSGDTERAESALNVLRAIDPLTKEYEEWLLQRVASPVAIEAMPAPA